LRLSPPLARRSRSLHRLLYESQEAHRGPWKLIYYEAYVNRHDAEWRELYLKSGNGRRFLRQQLRHYSEEFLLECSLYLGQPRDRRRRFYVATPLGFEPRI